MSPDLTVIVPLYNGECHVEAALNSVVENAERLLEVIVVDDGSTDGGPEIVRRLGDPVWLIEQENAGVSAARNAALQAARGELIAFLDHDDLWAAPTPDPRRAILERPGVDAVLGRVQPVAGDDLQPIGEPLSGVQLGALLAPRELLLEHGGFDREMRFSEDLDLILRMRDAGVRIELIPDVTVLYRQHGMSATRNREADRAGIVSAIRSSLVRRDAT